MTSPSPVTTARASLDRRHAEAGHAVQRSGHARADQIAAGVSRPSPARSWPQINPSLPLEQQLENRCFLEFRGRHYTVFSKSQPSARSRKTRAPRRAQQVRVHGFAERGLETSGAATASTRTARRAPELARVPTPASSQHRRVRPLHRRHPLAAPPVRLLLHRARAAARTHRGELLSRNSGRLPPRRHRHAPNATRTSIRSRRRRPTRRRDEGRLRSKRLGVLQRSEEHGLSSPFANHHSPRTSRRWRDVRVDRHACKSARARVSRVRVRARVFPVTQRRDATKLLTTASSQSRVTDAVARRSVHEWKTGGFGPIADPWRRPQAKVGQKFWLTAPKL
jgi:hypothetical protein